MRILKLHPDASGTHQSAPHTWVKIIDEITASLHKGVKLAPACDGSERCVITKLTFIEFVQGWIEFFSAGNFKLIAKRCR